MKAQIFEILYSEKPELQDPESKLDAIEDLIMDDEELIWDSWHNTMVARVEGGRYYVKQNPYKHLGDWDYVLMWVEVDEDDNRIKESVLKLANNHIKLRKWAEKHWNLKS